MERKKSIRKPSLPSLILTSDWHLREDTPTCFTGDWHQEQWKAVKVIRNLQAMYNCPVIHAGDLFHHWKPSPRLLSQALYFLPEQFYTIYGQHDLPQHNWKLREKSGLHTLEAAGRLTVLDGWHYGQTPDGTGMLGAYGRMICVWHHLTYIDKPFPGVSGGMAEGILRKYPKYDLIVTGDNHTSFTVAYKGRRLVNPGNLTRQAADQIDYKPRVALWYAEDNVIEWVPLPMQKGVISRDHITKVEERDKRIHAFITQLSEDWDVELSFEKNLERFQQANDVEEDVMQIIYESLERNIRK